MTTMQNANGTALHVLAVDDHADSVELLANLLAAAGHRVETADSGDLAIRMGTESCFDLAIVDISLPGKDGYDVARAIRSRWGQPRPVLVALSGHARDADVVRGREAGFEFYLIKPLDFAQLDSVLAEVSIRVKAL